MVFLVVVVVPRQILAIEHANTIRMPFFEVLAAPSIVKEPVGPAVHRKTLIRIASSIGMKKATETSRENRLGENSRAGRIKSHFFPHTMVTAV